MKFLSTILKITGTLVFLMLGKSRLIIFQFFSVTLVFVISFQVILAADNHSGESVYKKRINDPKAVYFTSNNFNFAGNGIHDDAEALQEAIDLVRKKTMRGIVFIPEGTYKLGKTVHLWQGIRLIGYGKNRPLFKLGKDTPGFQHGDSKYMIRFCHNPPDQDGNFYTFYSGIENINFEIGEGNPAAVAVRFRCAQHCTLENIDFDIGDGRGGIEETGIMIDNCSFQGGDFGIKTKKSAAGWQTMVMNCSFESQRETSIITEEAYMVLVRNRFKNVPIGIYLPSTDNLYIQDTWFEDIKNSAVVIDNYISNNLQVNFLNIKLSSVPYYVRFSGRVQGAKPNEIQLDYESPSENCEIKSFSQGLHIDYNKGHSVKRFFGVEEDLKPVKVIETFTPNITPVLPSQNTWINIKDLGAKGDGITDDTDVFKQAIEKYDAIYMPMGKYLISNTLKLKKNTKLIGFHPYMTQIILKDGTPGFSYFDDSKALILTPDNGANGIIGLGFDLGINPGAVGIKWMAGSNSYIDDINFRNLGEKSVRGEGQAGSLWISNEGTGTFKNIWIVDSRAQLPFYLSNSGGPGKIYYMSVEHHRDIEVKIDNVKNWTFFALQMEEDRGSEKALGMYLKDCRNLLFANLRSHRTSGVWEPYLTGIQIRNSRDITIRGNNMSGFVFPWDNAVFDEITGMTVSHKLFSKMVIE